MNFGLACHMLGLGERKKVQMDYTTYQWSRLKLLIAEMIIISVSKVDGRLEKAVTEFDNARKLYYR